MTQPFRSPLADSRAAREASDHARRLAMEAEQRGDMGEKKRHMDRALWYSMKADEYENWEEGDDYGES